MNAFRLVACDVITAFQFVNIFHYFFHRFQICLQVWWVQVIYFFFLFVRIALCLFITCWTNTQFVFFSCIMYATSCSQTWRQHHVSFLRESVSINTVGITAVVRTRILYYYDKHCIHYTESTRRFYIFYLSHVCVWYFFYEQKANMMLYTAHLARRHWNIIVFECDAQEYSVCIFMSYLVFILRWIYYTIWRHYLCEMKQST